MGEEEGKQEQEKSERRGGCEASHGCGQPVLHRVRPAKELCQTHLRTFPPGTGKLEQLSTDSQYFSVRVATADIKSLALVGGAAEQTLRH